MKAAQIRPVRTLITTLRGLVVLLGLLLSMIAGPFLLGAYAQRFAVLHAFRSQGSDGYPFTWQGALLLALVATLLAAAAALVLPSGRSRLAYLGATAGIICLSIPAPLALLSGMPPVAAVVGPLLLGLLVLWFAVRSRPLAVAVPALMLVLAVSTVAVATVREEEPRPCVSCPVTVAAFEAPGPLLPPMAYRDLVAELRATGVTVEELHPGGGVAPPDQQATTTPFLAIQGRLLLVGGERVTVFEYPSADAAAADAATIAPDGSHDERVVVPWPAPPHYYQRGPLIVESIGAASMTTDLLSRLLGPPFAGP